MDTRVTRVCRARVRHGNGDVILTYVPGSVISPCESRSVKDAFGRGYSRKRSECGARGREDTARSRAAWASSCRHYDRRVRCFTGLGQDGAGNTRGAACAPRPEGRSKDRTLRPRPRKHGLTLSLGDESPFGESREWNAGRRAVSREGGRAAPLGAEDKDRRLPAFRFLLFVARVGPTGPARSGRPDDRLRETRGSIRR